MGIQKPKGSIMNHSTHIYWVFFHGQGNYFITQTFIISPGTWHAVRDTMVNKCCWLTKLRLAGGLNGQRKNVISPIIIIIITVVAVIIIIVFINGNRRMLFLKRRRRMKVLGRLEVLEKRCGNETSTHNRPDGSLPDIGVLPLYAHYFDDSAFKAAEPFLRQKNEQNDECFALRQAPKVHSVCESPCRNLPACR